MTRQSHRPAPAGASRLRFTLPSLALLVLGLLFTLAPQSASASQCIGGGERNAVRYDNINRRADTIMGVWIWSECTGVTIDRGDGIITSSEGGGTPQRWVRMVGKCGAMNCDLGRTRLNRLVSLPAITVWSGTLQRDNSTYGFTFSETSPTFSMTTSVVVRHPQTRRVMSRRTVTETFRRF